MTFIMNLPNTIDHLTDLEELLSRPTPGAVESMKRLKGDLIILGAGGKMGPTLARMAKRASDQAGIARRIIGVSRFSEPGLQDRLDSDGVETIVCDLLDRQAIKDLPDCSNVLYMTGRKFGSTGNEGLTWAMNVFLPGLVAERYRKSRFVAFSTGNVYPFTPPESGGPTESDPTGPVGEYAQSCLGRERMFEYFSWKNGTPVTILRLNYAVEMRYGIVLDIARKVYSGIPIPLAMGYVNVIWQGDANAQTLQTFDHCASPVKVLNITGPETLSIRTLAETFGRRFGKEPVFEGSESDTALLNNAGQAAQLFGSPTVSIDRVIEWVAHWIEIDGPTLDKPTHYEQRNGKF